MRRELALTPPRCYGNASSLATTRRKRNQLSSDLHLNERNRLVIPPAVAARLSECRPASSVLA